MHRLLRRIRRERQTVKKYSDKRITNSDWDSIKEIIQWSPSSLGWEPYRVLIINRDNSLREKLKPMMWNQEQITSCDKLVFFISLKAEVIKSEKFAVERLVRVNEKVKGMDYEHSLEEAKKTYKFLMETLLADADDNWPMKQAYIALGNALNASTLLGIGTTAIEGFVEREVIKLFKSEKLINNNERIAVVAAFGYPLSNMSYLHKGTNKRVRVPLEEKFKEI